ncbi:MAG: PHP domain-containing protein [Deltaproteobacteria bacterium]|nr:PHP domain-containing protein [Deltaproteobacteria bacterium]
MRFELHCHSSRSDGALEPAEVARRAQADGADVFCLTDHDTTAGYPDTHDAGGMRVLRGLELSCHFEGRSVHILVYDLQACAERWQQMESVLEEVADARRARIHAMAEKLAARDIRIDAQAIIARATGKTVGRPDVARALIEVGAVRSMREAFDRYLGDGGPIDVPTSRLGIEEGVELGVAAGGKLSLAHPHVHGPRRARAILDRTVPLGLSGLEVHYGMYSRSQRTEWQALADLHGLVATGGSDFHEDPRGSSARLGVELDEPASRRLSEWLELAE